jgi:hypothetical protein
MMALDYPSNAWGIIQRIALDLARRVVSAVPFC